MINKKNTTKVVTKLKVVSAPSIQNEIDRIANERAAIIKIIDEQYETYVNSVNN